MQRGSQAWGSLNVLLHIISVSYGATAIVHRISPGLKYVGLHIIYVIIHYCIYICIPHKIN